MLKNNIYAYKINIKTNFFEDYVILLAALLRKRVDFVVITKRQNIYFKIFRVFHVFTLPFILFFFHLKT